MRLLAYAADFMLVEESQDGLFCQLGRAALKIQLHINENKMVYMVKTPREYIQL